MDGVISLDSCVTVSEGYVVILTFIELVLIGFTAAITFSCVESEKLWTRIWGVLMAIALMLVGFGFFRIFPRYTQLDVTLEDEVSWSEFADRYEVLDVKGRILTVREKEVKNGKDIHAE